MSNDYPPNFNVADVLYKERKKWLDSTASACVRNAKTKAEAQKDLAAKIEAYLTKSVNKAYDAVPAIVPMAMGMWEVDPDLDYDLIARLLIDDYWKAKPVKSDNIKSGTSKNGSRKSTGNTKNKSRNGKTSRKHRWVFYTRSKNARR